VKGILQMKRIVFVLALTALMSVSAWSVCAQTVRRQTAGASASSAAATAINAMPASDAVLTVDVQRLYKEALPRIYANDPAKLAAANADAEEFKTRTGLDPRQFERVAVGVRIAETASGAIRLAPVAIARGTFSAAALVAAGRIAAQGKYQEQAYKGKTIYLFSLDRQMRFFNLHWTDLAVVVLDGRTLAFGDSARVRAAIDAATGDGAHVASDVVGLALREPNAIVGFGGNVPALLAHQLDFLNPEISRSLASVRQFYGALGADAAGFQMLTVLRTGSAADADTLSATVEGLKQLAPLAAMRMSGEKVKLIQQLTESTKVTTTGSDVQISLTLADTNVATLVRVF
jgi:hypothetical protein